MSAAPLPATLLPRIGQLVRLLASDRDGETLGAARALERTLKAAGLDIHWLADRIEAGPNPKPPRSPEMPPLFGSLHPGARRAWLEAAVAHGEVLTDFEIGVCTTIRTRLQTQPYRAVTAKQAAVLTEVIGKLWLAGVRA